MTPPPPPPVTDAEVTPPPQPPPTARRRPGDAGARRTAEVPAGSARGSGLGRRGPRSARAPAPAPRPRPLASPQRCPPRLPSARRAPSAARRSPPSPRARARPQRGPRHDGGGCRCRRRRRGGVGLPESSLMSVQSSSGSLEGPPSWSRLSTSPTPGSAAAARSLLNHTPPSGRPREGKRRRALPRAPSARADPGLGWGMAVRGREACPCSLSLPASGLGWDCPRGAALAREPPPLVRTPPIEAVPAPQAGPPGPVGCPLPAASVLRAASGPTRIPSAAPRAIPTADRLVGKAARATPPDGCNFPSFAIDSCVFVRYARGCK